MPEPLKNLYSPTLISNLCNEISKHSPDFSTDEFTVAVFDEQWQHRELKQRMRHITECLHQYLPEGYVETIAILMPVAEKFTGFEYMFFQDYVECYGLHDISTSIRAMEHFTKFSSSEFAVRVFIIVHETRMMKQMMKWAKSKNHHVRRLASEGCRPRLPWAIALPRFKADPAPVLDILTLLMRDESEYVRRSVANNLNDISRDNPAIVQAWAEKWLGDNDDSDWIIKHGCRSLLKQGDKKVLSLFGYSETSHIKIEDFEVQPEVMMGDKLHFSFMMRSTDGQLGRCRIEFAIDFVKANGTLKRKVFKISEGDYTGQAKPVKKYFSFKTISTRRYYPGTHYLCIIVNGIGMETLPFDLII